MTITVFIIFCDLSDFVTIWSLLVPWLLQNPISPLKKLRHEERFVTGNVILRGARGLLVVVVPGVGTSENAAECTVTGTVELIESEFLSRNITMNDEIRTRSRR